MTVPRVFVWSTGQDDNIGDIVLRRRLLACFDVPGVTVDLYVGVNSEAFVQSLLSEIGHARIRPHRSKIGWVISMLRADRVVMVTNPGEIRLDASTLRAQLLLLIPQIVVRVRGGEVVRAGAAVRESTGVLAAAALAAVRLTQMTVSLTSWRDTASPQFMGTTGTAPDWAFSPAPIRSHHPRRIVMVTFRSDRAPLTDAECRAVRRLGAPVVYVQVRRDADAMADLASRLRCELISWPRFRSPLDQERLLRKRLRGAEFVVSDRIHALILGAGEGAQPVGLHSPGDHKIDLHFAVAGLPDIAITRTGEEFVVPSPSLEALTQAALDVDTLGRRLTRLVGAA